MIPFAMALLLLTVISRDCGGSKGASLVPPPQFNLFHFPASFGKNMPNIRLASPRVAPPPDTVDLNLGGKPIIWQ